MNSSRNKVDNVARTEQDYNAGILNGKTVFPFGEAGEKNMTMRTKYGNVPYPIKYRGTTNGVVTDQGVAQPNEDFVVNGDTVIEEPDFDKMTFSEALKHSKASNLGTFVWRGKEYKTGKMQKGGMVNSEPLSIVPIGEDGGYTDSVYPTLEPAAKNLIRDGRNYKYNWKTYFIPGSNAGAPIGTNSIMQQGGKVGYDPAINYTRQPAPQIQKPMFNSNSLQSTDVPQVKLPSYKCGQMIHYKHGGEIRAGVIKEYDERTGKIKLY